MRLIDADRLLSDRMRSKYYNLPNGDTAIPILDIILAPTVGGWISVNDRLPECGKYVLTSCEVRLLSGSKKRYTCIAFHAEKHKISEHFPEDDYCFDYDEEHDEYYLKEGWYEVIHNWDEYSSVVIEDFVTHWMPLPKPPEEVSGND